MKQPKRPPTLKALDKFLGRWDKAQRSKSVPRMEKLLELRWLNYWWFAMVRAGQLGFAPWVTMNYLHTVEMILQREGLIGTPPMRPSERAMMEAEKRGLA